MGEVVRLSSRKEVSNAAAEWIARLDRGATDEDLAGFRQWLSAHPRHMESLIEMARLWDEMDVLSELAHLFPLEQAGDRASGRPAARPWRGRWLWPAAASVALAVGAALLLAMDRDWSRGTTAAEVSFEQTLVTAFGQHAGWEMPDGSVITLNTDSEVTVEYLDSQRDIFLLRGEAHFVAAPDPGRPFRVFAGNGVVEAVGTAFNVRLHDQRHVEVAVAEGAVQVRGSAADAALLAKLPREHRQRIQTEIAGADAPADETVLASGDIAVFNGSAAQESFRVRRERVDDIEVRLAWQRGMLVFQGEPLETVLAEVARYAPVEFVLADDSLRTVRVGGYFRSADISGLLLALRENFDIVSEHVSDERIVLRRRP